MAKLIKKSERKPPKFKSSPPKKKTYPHAEVVYAFCVDDTDYDLWWCREDPPYINFKLVTRQRRRKANYWFGWHLDEDRLTGRGDQFKLQEHLPKVYKEVVRFIRERFGVQQ